MVCQDVDVLILYRKKEIMGGNHESAYRKYGICAPFFFDPGIAACRYGFFRFQLSRPATARTGPTECGTGRRSAIPAPGLTGTAANGPVRPK
jgi:hypothetical protein